MNIHSSNPVHTYSAHFKNFGNFSGPITIKVFETNGKKAKTLNLDHDLEDLDTKMYDLAKGIYVVNTFSKGCFLKSFRFIKE